VEERHGFALEVAKAVLAAIGDDRVAIRLSPRGGNAGMKPYPGVAGGSVGLPCAALMDQMKHPG
jgi:2,4-dienoyl-CoA reductase-like NADH-dependent reductase (Old Yellow Enzyme family)